MSKKNLVFTKDGMRVGIKQRNTENYVDATQSWVVKAWNLGTATNEEQEKNGLVCPPLLQLELRALCFDLDLQRQRWTH
jgi:hypothetical protein